MNTDMTLLGISPMKKLKKILLIVALPISLIGCSTFQLTSSINKPDNATRLCAKDNGDFYECEDIIISNSINTNETPNEADQSYLFNSKVNFQLLSEYTEQMAINLKSDVKYMNIDQPIVVASFVTFNNNLKTTTELGNQLTEYFMNDLQAIGLPVSDHKLTAGLQVTPQGDFSLSRNIEELNPDLEIGYVLTGTLIKNQRGIVVNVRLINREQNKVVASNSKLLPNLLIQNIY